MKTTTFCPISQNRIDEHVARLNGGFTVVLLSIFLISSNIFPILFLLIDFAQRSGKYAKYSLLAYFSRQLLKVLSVKPLLINAGPKIFAARIGLFFNFAIIVSYLIGLPNLAYLFTGIFGIFAFLESGFGFCVACQVYPLVYKLFYTAKFENVEA